MTTASVDSGVFRDAIDAYYNPKPPRPPDADMYSFRGSGNPSSASSWNLANSSSNNQYTNWDASLDQAGETPAELVVYVTDGDPSAYDFNEPGDPFSAGPPPDVGINTNRGDADAVTMDRAVAEADAIKTAGTRILAVGVGSALQSAASRARLIDIAGPNVIDDDDLDPESPNFPESINDVDVALVEDFDELAGFLRGVVSELCSPSLSIRKLAQTPGSIEFTPAPGWNITVTPSVDDDGSFSWILPDTDPIQAPTCGSPISPDDGAPRTCPTDATGLANFQWEPVPSDASTSAIVTEQLQDGYIAGRDGDDNDWTCRFKNIDGTEQTLSGEFDEGIGFEIDVDAQQIITCAVYNSFEYLPDISLTKTNDPLVVRGDLPAADRQVTSTYVVQNTGNTPLHGVDGGDYIGPHLTCSPIVYLSGDDGDAVLDHDPSGAGDGEAWTLECTSPAPRTSSPVGGYVNTAVVSALSPDAQRVDAQDSATVEVVNPAIELEKQVAEAVDDPAFHDLIEVLPGADVVYSFTATNTGDTVLSDVTITDPECDPDTIDPTSVASLAVGASAEFTCTAANVTESVINVATVSGTPDIPGYPTDRPNPEVTDTDVAEVVVLSVGILLEKTVEPRVVFDGDEVTYTYVVSLRDPQADAPLRPSDAEGNPVSRDEWVTDPRCVSPTYVSGDVGDDGVLEGDEHWTYSCTKTLTLATVNAPPLEVNIASVIGYPVDAEGEFDPELVVSDFDGAVVQVVQADIDIVKRASRGTVVDPTANCGTAQLACSGPDFSPPRTVDYTFEVSNPGHIAVDLTGTYPTADPPDPDDARIVDVVDGVEVCAATTYAFGDDGNGLLDPGETWTFECDEVTLTMDDAGDDGIVTDTVTVTGNGVIPGDEPLVDQDEVQAVDSVDVEVIQPDVTLTKTVSPTLVRPGGTVTYTFEVANTGNAPLTPQGILDDKCTPVGLDSGDDGDFVLEPTEVWVLSCTAVIESPDDPTTPAVENEVVNVASASLVDPEGNVYIPSAWAVVRVFDPAIDLVKTVDQAFVPVGSDVTYTFTVTNTGDDVELDVLDTIELRDVAMPALPVCRIPELVDDGDGDDVLAVDEVWVFECTATINANTHNVAGVIGRDMGGGLVEDVDGQYVAVFETGIDVVKSVTPTQLPFPGGPVTYSYEVRNTGDVPLSDVASRITDDTCGPVTYVSGDDDSNELLTGEGDQFETGPPEVWIFTCTMQITEDTTNVVTVNGTPVRPTPEGPERLAPDVVDDDTAFVDVLPPPPTTTTTTTTIPTTTTVAPEPLPPTPGPLPPTGGGAGAAALAVALLAGGAALVLTARRRHSASA